ncbi:hypothetical protein [Streptomyces nondiastaticus]|uniref:MftR C-terminal domain-containing protein n=1 Tax=Streptomyces nondiastaticus TaxID=3154512 RepID=A0ABW6U7Y4_9ACTN
MGIFAVLDERQDAEAEQRARRIRAAVPIEPLRSTVSVVLLEGPEHVAAIAWEMFNYAYRVLEDPDAHGRMVGAMDAFTVAARSHLNGGD